MLFMQTKREFISNHKKARAKPPTYKIAQKIRRNNFWSGDVPLHEPRN